MDGFGQQALGLLRYWGRVFQMGFSKVFGDDQKGNLEFLCPNCHSQTRGWCGSKGCAEVTSTVRYDRAWRARRKNGQVEELVDSEDLGSSV